MDQLSSSATEVNEKQTLLHEKVEKVSSLSSKINELIFLDNVERKEELSDMLHNNFKS